MKNIKFLIALLLMLPSIFQAILDPKNTIIAFDLDEVVLLGRETKYKDWLDNNPEVKNAISDVKKKYKVTDAFKVMDKVIEDYPQLKAKALAFTEVFTTAPQIKGTAEILKKLEDRGYSIVAASNMTGSTYQRMVDNKTLPPQFSRDFFFVATDELNKKNDSSYFEKPSPEYYQNLLQYIHRKYPARFTNFLFTDDKEINADGASKVQNIKSIHFKNSDQLLADLRTSGIDI